MRTYVVLAVTACAVLAGCPPPGSTRPHAPLAARLSGDRVEALYTACPPVGVTRIRVVDPRDGVINDNDPVLWDVSFDSPTNRTSFLIGEVPPGGTELIGMSTPLKADVDYAVYVHLETGASPHIGFEISRLANGRVSFNNRYMSADEFARLSACERTPPPRPS